MADKTKTKKVSITTFEDIMKETYIPITTVDWNGAEVTIKNTLSLAEVLSFVDSVTKSCFAADEGAYLPEVKAFAIKCCILEMYANFALPSNIERRYALVYCTDAVDMVMHNINHLQLSEIIEAINDKVDNIAQANIEAINKQMNELFAAFEGLQKQLTGAFSGVEAGDIPKIVGAITNGQFSEEKLIEAYKSQHKPTDGEQ